MAKDDKKPTESAPATQAPELMKKLTTKGVLDERVSSSDVKDGAVQLYSIIGVCTGIKTGESQYGGWTGFTGQFEAERFSDGKRFVAPVAFIPEPASGMMLAAFNRAASKSQGDISDVNIQFAFIIGAKKSNAAIGFEYTVEPVLQASQNDALKGLRDLVANKRPALPAASSK